MKILRINNKGLLDVSQLIYMGCSDKDGISTIGKFGTGLKYAIAVLKRLDIDFSIYVGKKKISISTEEKTIGKRNYDTILIDFIRTSYTTNLGVEWELWQAVREFIANAIDAGGFYDIIEDSNLSLSENETTITIDLSQIEDTLDKFDFEDWISVGDGLFYKETETKRPAKIFKEGFLVYIGEESSYDYRIDSLKINEARVAEDRWEVKTGIGKIQARMGKEEVETLVENKELDLGYIFENDDLSDGWTQLSNDIVRGISYQGYQLKEAIIKNKSKERGQDRVKTIRNSWIGYSADINLRKLLDSNIDVFLQNSEDTGIKNGWDIPEDCSFIIIGVSSDIYENYESNLEEINDEFISAYDYIKGLDYVTKNCLSSAAETAVHFLKIIEGMNEQMK